MTIFGFSISRAAKDYGWALAIVISILAYIALAGSSQVGVSAPGIAPVTQIKIAPASGIEGFDATPFCNDP